MKACLDVDYRGDHAIAACLLFANWEDAAPCQELTTRVNQIAAYEPGFFYRRELPCLLTILQRVQSPLECIVIDGYVWLDEAQKAGLGAHLFAALEGKTPVIGVAKTHFLGAPASEVKRGSAERPLYVSAAGVSSEAAAAAVARMHGSFRIPTLLKRVDQLCRQAVE